MDELVKRSLWQERRSEGWSFYCPLCCTSRRLPYRSRPGGLRHWSQVLLTAAFFMIVTWNWFEWKGFVVVLPFWAVFEAIYRMKLRGAAVCPNCGFDPYLYLVDAKRARRDVEAYWRKRFEEKGIPYPDKNRPPLPVEKAPPAESAATSTPSTEAQDSPVGMS